MKRLFTLLAATAIGLGALLAPSAASAATTGFTVSNGKIYDANGTEFIPQGINHAHAWYPSQTGSIAAIRAAGANTVRVVLSGGRYGNNSASNVASVIAQCKTNQLVCILDYHDTTGYGEDSSATSLAQAAAYWTSIKSVLIGQEKYVMINIGNEPFGNSGYQNWKDDTISAIQTMRAAGLSHTLIADAPNWGQDWSFTMRDNAAAVAAVDSNVVFGVHMYGVFDTASEVRSYIDSFRNQNLALLVGEFGSYHSDGDPDEATIMSYTRTKGVGLLAWSWSGNTGGVEYLDLVNGFNASSLTPWGQRFLNGADGLAARAPQVATVYGSASYPTCASASSDPDGDGWGWENGQSCKVAQTAPNGYPYCVSSSSDPDGDGWGWENSRSCVVR